MVIEKIVINLPTGLEPRSAHQVVLITQKYSSEVYIEKDNKRIDCKSIMGIISLGISSREEITLVADGTDVEELMNELKSFLSGEINR